MRVCKECKKAKPLEDFRKQGSGRRYVCNGCSGMRELPAGPLREFVHAETRKLVEEWGPRGQEGSGGPRGGVEELAYRWGVPRTTLESLSRPRTEYVSVDVADRVVAAADRMLWEFWPEALLDVVLVDDDERVAA